MKHLYRTTIEIWTEYGTDKMDLDDLVREATEGDAICTKLETKTVNNPEVVPEGALSFFLLEDEIR